jgi:hypothetical protein
VKAAVLLGKTAESEKPYRLYGRSRPVDGRQPTGATPATKSRLMRLTRPPAMMAPLDSTQLGGPAERRIILRDTAAPRLRREVGRHTGRRRPSVRYPPAEPGAEISWNLVLMGAVSSACFPTIDPPRLAFGFIELIARHLQLDVAMIAAGRIGKE